MVRKTSFKSIAIELLQQGREIELNSEYSRESWGFIDDKQSEGVSGRKTTRRKHQG